MKIRPILIFSALCGAMLLSSCKKDKKDEVEYKNSFSGILEFSLPEFVAPEAELTVTPSGLSRADGKGIGYSWSVEAFKISKQVVREEADPEENTGAFVFRVKDTLGVISVKCTAFAEGYYSTTKAREMVVVHPTKSLSYNELRPCVEFSDPRDGKKYQYVLAGNLKWMRNNLAYSGSGMSYKGCEAMDPVMGRYYTWEEARRACPEGWRLPGREDWADLAHSISGGEAGPDSYKGVAGSLMVNASFNGTGLWEFWPEVRIDNRSGFSALPAGYVQKTGSSGHFDGVLEYAAFWTADPFGEEQAVYHYLYTKNPDLLQGTAHKDFFAASVRCVRD